MEERIPLSWKEKLAGWLVILVGVVYLLLQVVNLLSSKSNGYTVKDGALVISKAELLSDLRTYLYIILGITGGWLLLKGKRAGWILCVPFLTIFAVLSVWGLIYTIKMGLYDLSLGFVIAGILLFFLSLFFLVRPMGIKRYRVNRNTVLLTLLFLVLLVVFYFFLQ